MRDTSPYAGKTVRLRVAAVELGGYDVQVVDWYENIGNKVKWRDAIGRDPRAEGYNLRHGLAGLPDDDDVLFGRVDGMGQIIHRTEIEGEQAAPATIYGPKPADSREVGRPCPACQRVLVEGDTVSVHVLGPGPNQAARRKAREGKPFEGIAVELHWACATGDESYEAAPPDGGAKMPTKRS